MFKFYDVATSLKNSADSNKKKNEELAIAYGRTSFNRYYYACYLSARDLVKKLLPELKFKHGGAPDLIEKNVVNLIKGYSQKQQKDGLITIGDYSRIIQTTGQSASEIARILKVGYMVRGIADYEPEIVIVFEEGTFSLNDHTESEARSWLGAVDLHKGKILRNAKELGIVS